MTWVCRLIEGIVEYKGRGFLPALIYCSNSRTPWDVFIIKKERWTPGHSGCRRAVALGNTMCSYIYHAYVKKQQPSNHNQIPLRNEIYCMWVGIPILREYLSICAHQALTSSYLSHHTLVVTAEVFLFHCVCAPPATCGGSVTSRDYCKTLHFLWQCLYNTGAWRRPHTAPQLPQIQQWE